MDEYEAIRRTDAAIDAFADRVPTQHMPGIRELASVGERAEAVSNLIAALAQSGAVVTPAERDELRALAQETGEGDEFLDGLTVQG